MGTLQVVFADNPRPAAGWEPSAHPKVKKALQSQGKTSKVKRKVGSRMKPTPKQLAWRKKFAKMAKARSKAARAKKSKKKNPYILKAKKGKRTVTAGKYLKKNELNKLTKHSYKYDEALGRGYLRKRSKKGRAVARASKAIKRVLKAAPSARRKALSRAAALRKKGYKIKKVYVSPKSVLASAVAGVRRKRKGKRKTSRKESKVAKRRRKKKSGARRRKSKRSRARRAPRRRRASRRRRRSAKRGRVIVLKRKGQSVTIRRRNPSALAMVEQYSGFRAEELGSLLVGGAIYGTVDGLAQRYLPQVYVMAAKIPVIGTTIVPALIGAGIKFAAKKTGIKALDLVGEGLVGAAVVAMGIQASQYLPGISSSAPVAGVDFTPGRGVLMGYPRDGADFGNVDFTPGPGVLMGSQPQLGMEAQMGGYARDGADFGSLGEIPEGLGLVPEGLGSLG